MANPTGTVYLQANNSYVWTDGDVYEIPQTDQVEGAATGASFTGLGVDNQPHQALLNKVQLLHKNQLVDEANIAALQSEIFSSAVGVNGWLEISSDDVNLGEIHPILQWGTISLLPYGGHPSQSNPVGELNVPPLFALTFPISFPNAIWVLLGYPQTNNTNGAAQIGVSFMPVIPFQLRNNQFAWLCQTSSQGQPYFPVIAYSPSGALGLTGIGWIAFGY
jgi:hypothetical protein